MIRLTPREHEIVATILRLLNEDRVDAAEVMQEIRRYRCHHCWLTLDQNERCLCEADD